MPLLKRGGTCEGDDVRVMTPLLAQPRWRQQDSNLRTLSESGSTCEFVYSHSRIRYAKLSFKHEPRLQIGRPRKISSSDGDLQGTRVSSCIVPRRYEAIDSECARRLIRERLVRLAGITLWARSPRVTSSPTRFTCISLTIGLQVSELVQAAVFALRTANRPRLVMPASGTRESAWKHTLHKIERLRL